MVHPLHERPGHPGKGRHSFLDLVASDYLRPEAPSLASSYRRACSLARAFGIDACSISTVRRRLAEIPTAEVDARRQPYSAKGSVR